jgi:RNA polymerase sigma factor (sigma-70 family)
MRDAGTRSFEEVYDDHVWDVYGFFAYRLDSREDAEDLTQLTFERALRAWRRFDPTVASARTWLTAIARNALIDHHRRRGVAGRTLSDDDLSDAEVPSVSGPDERPFGPDPELAAALGRLTDRERDVIALRFGADLNGPEIAAQLELTLANVQQLSSRALRKLRSELVGQDASGPTPITPSPATARRTAPEDR